MPPILTAFHQKFKEVRVTLLINNTEQIEQALYNKEIDLGIIEGRSKNKTVKYQAFLKDEIVLVSGINNPLALKNAIKPEELKKIPLLLREPGSGTLEVIAHALQQQGIAMTQLKVEMELGNSESIKSYLPTPPVWPSFLSMPY
ncbi:LysR substrate-binding domain-containing protein [Paraflavitalea speifideaquila]|uniref:LysR substrate-binding domain-containing protein n=1 Tax=Paraflavitalea speifideaquila TaxID=3076558 RepID=UPI0028F13010|nr:LysR substrate-binding domain-containing protein [Paraflavitalea speifideiaquila]